MISSQESVLGLLTGPAQVCLAKIQPLANWRWAFCSSMHKWGLVSSCNCECGAHEETADHIISACFTHQAPKGPRGLSILDDDTRCSRTLLPSSDKTTTTG